MKIVKQGLAALLACSLVACSNPFAGKDEKSSSQPSASASASPSTTASSAPAGKLKFPPAPVAGYVAANHEVRTNHKAPERTTVASTARPAGFVEAPPGKGMQRYLGQKINWTKCGNRTCAKVTVPLNWDDPDGQAITLALKRATATQTRRGSMFVNPGGPGVGAQFLVDQLPARKFPSHDVIAWDPRGTGESTPIKCAPDAEIDRMMLVDGSPDDPKEWDALIAAMKEFSAGCRKNSGALLDHVSTIDTARDLDYLRHLVGDEKLDYLGISYGTWIGAVYAEMYPDRVGRMVLDSAVDVADDATSSQEGGFELAVTTFAAWCAKRNCAALGTTTDKVMAKLTDLVAKADQAPLEVGDRTLDQSSALLGLLTLLYGGERAYPLAVTALENWQAGDGEMLLRATDAQAGRNDDGTYDAQVGAHPAIRCLDEADDGLASEKDRWAKMSAKYPFVGRFGGPSLSCTWWTAKPVDQLIVKAQGAAPILVLGVTGDPATPYKQARTMAEQLESGVLLTWKGEGHSAWSLGNKCVKDAVMGYMTDGVVPKDQTVC